MRGLPRHKNRWQALQHYPTSRQNEGEVYPHPRTSVRRRRSPCSPLCNSPTETHWPVCPCLQRVRANHQPKENKGFSPRFLYAPVITIDVQPLEVVPTFTYLGSTVSSSVNLDSELNCKIGKALGTITKLNSWNNSKLTENTIQRVYQACVLSSLLYGSKTWTTYRRQEERLNSFYLQCP